MAARKRRKAAKGKRLIAKNTIQVTLWTLEPGASTQRFLHKNDYVMVPLTAGRLKRSVRQGNRDVVRYQTLVANRPYFRAVGTKGLDQSVENVGSASLQFFKIVALRPKR